jgi:hypothetical protein
VRTYPRLPRAGGGLFQATAQFSDIGDAMSTDHSHSASPAFRRGPPPWRRRPSALKMLAAEEAVRTTIPCRKSETGLSSPHEQSCASAWPRPHAPLWAPLNPGKGGRNILLTKIPRNPLKRFDSDERIQEIQGNPTLVSGGLAAKRPGAKKTQMERPGPTSPARCREGAKPAPSRCKAPIARFRSVEPSPRGAIGRRTTPVLLDGLWRRGNPGIVVPLDCFPGSQSPGVAMTTGA